MADIDSAPFSGWLEGVIKDMYDIEPSCIALALRDSDGKVFTSYWNMDANDLSCIIDTLKEEALLTFVRNNRKLFLEIFNEEGDEEDGLCESDTETDSTG